MALVIDLKPQEKILIGNTVITNDAQRTRIHIAGDAPILREKDVMQEKNADTPCKKIYFLIQCMYLADDSKDYIDTYFAHIKEIQDAAPSTSVYFMDINDQILAGSFYKAMKAAKKLIEYESELIGKALASDKGEDSNSNVDQGEHDAKSAKPRHTGAGHDE